MSETIQQSVIVKKVENQYAWVLATHDSSCENCSSKSGCSSTNLLKPLLDATIKNQGLRVVNTLNASVGDEVKIELSATSLLKATMLAYLLPLLGLFIFAWLGKILFGETASIILGLFGLITGLALIKYYLGQSVDNTDIEPVMVDLGEDQSIIRFS